MVVKIKVFVGVTFMHKNCKLRNSNTGTDYLTFFKITLVVCIPVFHIVKELQVKNHFSD